MLLNPLHLKVGELLSGRLFRIPEYQRAYAWGKRQRDDFFQDVLDVHRTKRDHFMATVVALSRDKRLIGADEFQTVEIVDGQQRITSIIVLLKAIEKTLDEGQPQQFKSKRDLGDLFVKSDAHQLILLQTNHDSSNIFSDYLRTGVVKLESAVTSADQNLVDAAVESEAFVREWCRGNDPVELVATVRNKLSMIYHQLGDEATVYRVFEVLNSRGLDVKWIDKLKSQLMALIFENVEGGGRVEAVKEMHTTWQNIYRTLGLRGELGDEALRFAGTWAISSAPSKILSQESAAAQLVEKAGGQLSTIAQVGAELERVVQAVHELDTNVRLKAVTRISHARFVAVAITMCAFDAPTKVRLLAEWERVTFRVFGLGGADTRNKVGDYVRLGHAIRRGKITADDIEKRLQALGRGFNLKSVIYGPEFWDQCYDGWTEDLRYLMFRYDEYLSKQAGEKLNAAQWAKIWAADSSKSIEHIKPQSSGVDYMHNIGNLVMLPPGVNSSLKDKPPKEKCSTYVACGLRATAAVGKQISDGANWNERAVRERAAAIEAFVRTEWGSHPLS